MTNDEKPASPASRSERAQREEKVLQFWKKNKIFEKSLEKPSPKGEFVFYDGPPFATGLPHYGSLLPSVIKDLIPRYKTMRGFHVRRRWGWDCHGLPIENMVEKELGIKSKKEIEEMGVAEFNRACRSSVLRFDNEWKIFIDRVGRFVDYDHSYKTMDNTYIESVWWALKEIHKKGLLYEGRKVLLYCPHCETPLAKAEIAMDHSYKDITEESVTAEFRVKGRDNVSFLAWTTTPWTLPGNVALAVHPDIDYVEIEKRDNGVGKLAGFILAKDRLKEIFADDQYKIVRQMKGGELVGLEYEPLYEIPAVGNGGKKAWYVASADFVNTEEGTGIVHTAVIYGEDDYALGLKLDLPMVPLLDPSGHFNDKAPELIRGQYFKKAEKSIKEDLEKRGLLFKREMHTHSYPHCHRCGTALLYNAISSWFIDIQKKKSRMIELNEKINWVPGHLKHGRFLNNLENAPDWTISRNRYWASPLPIWKDESGKIYIIGSLEELKQHLKKSGNKYFTMRHGESDNIVKGVGDMTGDPNNHLTEKGKKEVKVVVKNLSHVDLIITSPFPRTRETAEIVKKEIGLANDKFVVDERLHEVGSTEDTQTLRRRMGEFIFDIEKKYQGKNILLVSHGMPMWVLHRVSAGEISDDFVSGEQHHLAEVREMSVSAFPHNDDFELDLHRPYIDEVELVSEDGKLLKRIPEVIDGWVESGSMPFAEYHYPFENQKEFEKSFPGDFIAEYIAQTRTWFYYMHAMAVILFDDVSFRNVVTTGNILALDGSKMSKSKGNYTDPMINMDRFGADALRYYLMSSVVMQAEDTSFSDEEVRQVHNQVINILWNAFKFYELYSGQGESDFKNSKKPGLKKSEHVLDRWITSRLNELNKTVTEALDSYDTVRATRPIRDFISDFSTWYIRRSRSRFKSDDRKDKDSALATTRLVLLELSKIIAPVVPFIAEDIYQEVKGRGDSESVHLESWPESGRGDKEVLDRMEETRKLVSLALEARSKAGIKIRQPLNELRIKNKALGDEYLEVIKDEVNVKSVVVDENLESEVILDTNLTPELIEEGKVRDAIRLVQDWRKEKGLKPGGKAEYKVAGQGRDFFLKHKEKIERATNIEFN